MESNKENSPVTEVDKLTAGAFMPKLDSIFTEVENNLPSIDFDVSDVSSDEDVAIFQRCVKTPTFDDDKDLDESLSTSSWEQLFQSQSDLPDNDIAAARCFHSHTATLGANTSSCTGQATVSQGTSTEPLPPPDGPLNNRTLKIDTSVKSEKQKKVPPSVYKKNCNEVRPELVETKKSGIISHSTRPSSQDVVSRYLPNSGPALTFQDLGNIDLNAVMDLSSGDAQQPSTSRLSSRLTSHSAQSATSVSSHSRGTSADTEDLAENLSLIERLAQFSVRQSGTAITDLDPETGAPCRTARITERRPHVGGYNLKAQKTAKNIEVEALQKGSVSLRTSSNAAFCEGPGSSRGYPGPAERDQERATVFIDLRNFGDAKDREVSSFQSVQRILGLTEGKDEDSSSSDEEEDPLLWHEQRRRMKEAIRARKPITQLHLDISSKRKQGTTTEAPKPVLAATKAQRLARPAQQLPPDGRTGTSHPGGSTKSVPDAITKTSPSGGAPSTDKSGQAKPATPTVHQTEKDKQKNLDVLRSAREKREAERQSRIRLSQRLEALRPKHSVHEKYKAAEATPIIFDLEASYEPAPQCLPSPLGNDCVLLTVHLACNGEIIVHRGNTNRSVDSGHGLSASYTTLLTWLLSLVPDDFTYLQTPGGAKTASTVPPGIHSVPFKVVALQQMSLEDHLALYVAVCPTESYLQSPKKGKKSKKRDDFAAIVSKFLSTNTLRSVCPWLQDMVSMEVRSADVDDAAPFVYRPPLPNITNKPLSTFVQVNSGFEASQKVFNLAAGFFWHTIENDDTHAEVDLHDDDIDYDTQNTMSLVYKKVYHDPRAMMGILNRVLKEGLDLAGVRLLYPTAALMRVAAGQPTPSPATTTGGATGSTAIPPDVDMMNKIGPILGLALRGTLARTLWLDAVGPVDPSLARRTDPHSLCALYGGDSRDECLLFCPRNPARISTELARWFGGRVPASGVVNVGVQRKHQPSSGGRRTKGQKVMTSEIEADLPSSQPPAMLTASVRGDIVLIMSPLVPIKSLGLILATCQRRGYQLRGIRRLRLTARKANALGLSGCQASIFTYGGHTDPPPGSAPMSDVTFEPAGGDAPAVPCRPVTVLLLSRENCSHNAAGLVEAFMVQMALKNLLRPIQSELSEPLTSSLLFHTVAHSDGMVNILGGDFSKVPQTELAIAPGYIAPQLHSNPEMEQIVTVTLTSHHVIKTFGLFLGRLLGVAPLSKSGTPSPAPQALAEGFELLGIKWLPSLSVYHAKELTPHEVGDPLWRRSIQALTSEPAVVLVLRGIDGHRRLEALLSAGVYPQMSPRSAQVALERIVTATPEMAYHQMSMFFCHHELFPDPTIRRLLPYLPQGRNIEGATDSITGKRLKCQRLHDLVWEESIFDTMLLDPQQIVSILVAKPDIVRRNLAKLMKRIAQEGFSLVAARLTMLTPLDAAMVTPDEDRENDVLCGMHRSYLTSAPSLVLCLQRENAVYKLLELLGPTDPQKARRQGQHLWRSTLGSDAIVNGLHCSRDYRSAVEEVHHFFPRGLCCQSTEDLEIDKIPCLLEDDVIDFKLKREVTLNELDTSEKHCIGSTRSSGTTCVNWRLSASSLTQTNCLLLSPALVRRATRGRRPGYVEILDALFSHGFEVVGLRMVTLTESQAEQYLCLSNAGSFQLVPLLTSGASLVVALQRDNAVMAFESLLGSLYIKDSIISKYGDHILRPKDDKQAHKHLTAFFDHLIPGAQLAIRKRVPAGVST